MSKSAMINKLIAPGFVLGALGLAATPAAAVDLATKAFDMTMPDGSVVTMWGFVLDTAGCYNESGQNRLDCIDGLTATVPGPRLIVSEGSGDLTIRLIDFWRSLINALYTCQELR